MITIIIALYFAINISVTAYLYTTNTQHMKTSHRIIGVIISSFLLLPIIFTMAIYYWYSYFIEKQKKKKEQLKKQKNKSKKKHK